MVKLNLGRARKLLRRHLAEGWARAVFVAPGGSGGERVLEGPGLGDPADPAFVARRERAFTEAMTAAADAATAGLFRHTFVLDPRRSVRVDARHGRPRRRERDDESLRKTMGGKARALRPDDSEALLRAIGIMSADGSISARHAKKYKQINHLVEVCRPLWERRPAPGRGPPSRPLRVLDLACGNSYVSFVLAAELRRAGRPARVIGIDARDDVIARSRARADELGLADHMEFEVGSIRERGPAASGRLGGAPDIVVALHACDTATDEAMALAISAEARSILVSPCCHAELARKLDRPGSPGDLLPSPALREHALLRQALGEVLTDALRVETLEACGYAVSLLELVEGHHAPKNLLIRAQRRRRTGVDPRADLEAVAHRWAARGIRTALFERLAVIAGSD